MTSNHHPENRQTPPETEDSQQAELFAASAAEGALTDRKSPSESQGLHELAVSTDHTSQDHVQTPPTAGAQTTEGEPPDLTEKSHRVLSKEELVEEALNCPCIASMRDGPCGDSFITAYKCFLESETDPKGMDCMDQFKGMQACIAEHPEEYNLDDDEDDNTDPFVAQKSASAEDADARSGSSSAKTGDPSSITTSSASE